MNDVLGAMDDETEQIGTAGIAAPAPLLFGSALGRV
jgi:hypothetical protein